MSVMLICPGFVKSEICERAYDADGQPLKKSPVRKAEVMTAEECARIMINAIGQRKREEVMTLRGKLGLWLKLVALGAVDRIARQAIEEGR